MKFEWDGEKNKINIEKHGIDFVDAALIFDNIVLEKEDTRSDYGEKRFIGIGNVNNIEISIVYTRRRNKIRIISARRARKDERQKYRSVYQGYSSEG
ncbi:MAG TPA: BrnT family toxin [Flavitalea sp.]|nr:BrnT family toxin [Flavitalea sp.]